MLRSGPESCQKTDDCRVKKDSLVGFTWAPWSDLKKRRRPVGSAYQLSTLPAKDFLFFFIIIMGKNIIRLFVFLIILYIIIRILLIFIIRSILTLTLKKDMFYSKCEETSKFSLGHYFLSTVMIIYGKIHKAQKIHMKKKVPPEIHRRMSSTIRLNRVICFYQWELGFELLTFYLKLISNIFFFNSFDILGIFSFTTHQNHSLLEQSSELFFFSKEKQQNDTKRSETLSEKSWGLKREIYTCIWSWDP